MLAPLLPFGLTEHTPIPDLNQLYENRRVLSQTLFPSRNIFLSVRELTPALRFFSVARERTHLLNEIQFRKKEAP